MATYTHTQTKIHGVLGLTYPLLISSSHTNKYANMCGHIEIYTVCITHYRTHLQMRKHSYIHTNMHAHAHYKAYIKRLSEARPALWAILDPD